jgi:hypothetical protein
MILLPRYALIAGLIWILACVIWLVLAARNSSPRTVAGLHGYPGEPTWSAYRYPSLLVIALAPVVSAVQYIATRHLYFWAGACVVFSGLLVIVFGLVFHLLLARRWANRASRPVAATFREKSIMVQIVSILTVYGFFGVRLWGFWDQPSMSSAAAGAITAFALIGITICMIIIGIVSHVALVFYARPETPDERDRVIGLRGSRNAYGVLTVGIWCVLYLAITGVPHGALLYAIMGAFALAELIRLGSQLLYYRLGA